MEIQGKIIQVLPAMEGVGKDGNPWKVQPYVLETNETYPRKVYFEVFGEDRINKFPCEVGNEVTVSFDLESREFNGRWYTSVRAWRIAIGTQAVPAAQPVEKKASPAPKVEGAEEESSDLPF